jgi:hypothetical protein
MISRHIRSNIVGYVALFFALTGTAAALQGKNSVRANDIAKGAVTTPKIRADAVTAAKLAQGSVGAGAIAAQAVGASEIANGAVGSPEIANGAVGASELASGAVGTDKIAAGAVTGAQLNQPTLGLGPASFGQMPALRIGGVLSQTAPAIAATTVEWDPGNVSFNIGGFGIATDEITVPIDGLYYVRLFVPWGDDPDDADRQFVAQLTADGDLVQTGSARAVQDTGFNYGPSTESAGLVELTAGDVLYGEVYYSGATPAGGIPLAGLGFTTLEAFWIGPS